MNVSDCGKHTYSFYATSLCKRSLFPGNNGASGLEYSDLEGDVGGEDGSLVHYLEKPRGYHGEWEPREVQRPKSEGPQAPRFLVVGPPEALHSP